MHQLSYSRRDSFKKIITINGRKFKHFDILNIPKNFGCSTTLEGKEGISEYINHKGLTYYAE
jgi:hypothetical protein